MDAEDLRITEIKYGSDVYKAVFDLRCRTFLPLGFSFSQEDLLAEKTFTHIAGLIEQKVVGCAMLVPIDENTVRIRQMAVEPDLQGQHLGRKILAHAEKLALSKGYRQAILTARLSVSEFYVKSGYVPAGQSSMNAPIPNQPMKKIL